MELKEKVVDKGRRSIFVELYGVFKKIEKIVKENKIKSNKLPNCLILLKF